MPKKIKLKDLSMRSLMYRLCPDCGGSGNHYYFGEFHTCEKCNGVGAIPTDDRYFDKDGFIKLIKGTEKIHPESVGMFVTDEEPFMHSVWG